MRTGIYARVSTADQNCELQLRELRKYVASRDWIATDEYVDDGYSGKTANRPQLKRCLKDAKSRRLDVIVVWKFDRWGRTVKQLNDDILDLDSAGVRFISITDGIDTDKSNPVSTLLRNMLAAFAQFEADVIKERTLGGFRNYQNDFNAGKQPKSRSGRNLAIGRPKKIFNREEVKELRLAGESWKQIASKTGLAITTARRFAQ